MAVWVPGNAHVYGHKGFGEGYAEQLAGWIVFMWGGQMIDAYMRFAGLR